MPRRKATGGPFAVKPTTTRTHVQPDEADIYADPVSSDDEVPKVYADTEGKMRNRAGAFKFPASGIRLLEPDARSLASYNRNKERKRPREESWIAHIGEVAGNVANHSPETERLLEDRQGWTDNARRSLNGGLKAAQDHGSSAEGSSKRQKTAATPGTESRPLVLWDDLDLNMNLSSVKDASKATIALVQYLSRSVDSVEASVDTIDVATDDIHGRMEGLETTTNAIENTVNTLDINMHGLPEHVQEARDTVYEIKEELDNLKEDVVEIKEKMGELKEAVDDMKEKLEESDARHDEHTAKLDIILELLQDRLRVRQYR